MNHIHRSKVDKWLGILLGGIPIALVFAVWRLLNAPVPGRWIVAAAILLLGVGLPASLLAFTTYTITDTFLTIRSGVFKWKVPIQSISKAEPTTDPAASPALSLDRIRIVYGHTKSVLVSPVNKEAFLRDLHRLGVPHT